MQRRQNSKNINVVPCDNLNIKSAFLFSNFLKFGLAAENSEKIHRHVHQWVECL